MRSRRARCSTPAAGCSGEHVLTILKDAEIEPAPNRLETSWAEFLRQQAASILECDFLTVDTLFLKRV
jgi:putative transposase